MASQGEHIFSIQNTSSYASYYYRTRNRMGHTDHFGNSGTLLLRNFYHLYFFPSLVFDAHVVRSSLRLPC